MADPNMTKNNSSDSNQTMQREQAKAEVGGDRQREQSGMDKDRQEKGAIGGQAKSETGESGRARDELDKNRSEPTGQR